MTRRRQLALAAGLMALVLVIGLLRLAGQFAPIDELGMRIVTKLHGVPGAGLLTSFSIGLHWLGEAGGRLFVALALGMFLARAGRPGEIVWLIGVVVGIMLLNPALKLFFAAERPIVFFEVPPIVTGYSFPSGHASGAMALWGGIALLTRLRAVHIGCATMILATGASRVWLGVHTPSDVTAGWLEGVAWLLVMAPLRPGAAESPRRTGGRKRRPGRSRHALPEDVAARPFQAPD